MRKISAIISSLLLVSGLNAQTIYDVYQYTSSDLNGTARYIGMGGAMGALGGDITTIGTNPAGIGIYRSNDFTVSFGFNSFNTKSEFGGTSISANKFSGSFDNAGFVYSTKIGDKTPVRYVNFGFNYTKQKNFNRNMSMGGVLGDSQTDLFAAMASQGGWSTGQFSADDAYTNDRMAIGWLPLLGYNAHLINPVDDKGNYEGYMPGARVDGSYRSKETGWVDRYDFNVAFNINDAFYVGATIGAYDVTYRKYSFYQEIFTDNLGYGGDYVMQNWMNTDGAGVDFKLGFIYRPVGTSFKVGAAFHTPTFYKLTDRTNVLLDFESYDLENNRKEGWVAPTDRRGKVLEDNITDYQIITPWKFNLSLGYTIGQSIAIGAEYEFADYSSAKVRYSDGYDMVGVNQDINSMLKGVHTLKLGVEARVLPRMSVRAGYNHITSAFENYAYKYIPETSIKTDTDYNNINATNNFTLGLGYRGNIFYTDIAYQYNMYKSDFYPFESVNMEAPLLPTKVNNNRQQVVMTIGMRF